MNPAEIEEIESGLIAFLSLHRSRGLSAPSIPGLAQPEWMKRTKNGIIEALAQHRDWLAILDDVEKAVANETLSVRWWMLRDILEKLIEWLDDWLDDFRE